MVIKLERLPLFVLEAAFRYSLFLYHYRELFSRMNPLKQQQLQYSQSICDSAGGVEDPGRTRASAFLRNFEISICIEIQADKYKCLQKHKYTERFESNVTANIKEHWPENDI